MAKKHKGAGQTALITGASGGIGLELARCFAKDGYDLVLVARSSEALAGHAAALAKEFSIKCEAITSDLSRVGAGAELVKALDSRNLTIDVLVNNAGYGTSGAFAESELVNQLAMMDLNMRALVELTGLLLPRMIKTGRGGIINVGSTGSFQPAPLEAVYCASKAFVLSFSEAVWDETRGTGVTVTCLCPGPTATGFAVRAGVTTTPMFRNGDAMPARRVAELGYRAFCRRKRLKIAGLANTLKALSVRFAPRGMVLKIARRIVSPLP